MHRIKSAKIGWIVLAMALTMAASAVFQIITYRSARQMSEIGRRDAHVRDVLTALATLQSALQDAVIGQRGYLLTGDSKDLLLYQRAAGRVPELMAEVCLLTADEPVQSEQARRLTPLVQSELEDLRKGLDAPRHQPLAAASQAGMGITPDPTLTEQISRAIDRLIDEEQQVRAVCLAQTQAASAAQARSLVAASIYRVFVLVAGCTLILRQQVRQKQAEDRLRHQSLHDALTGLPNRLLLNERIQRGIERANQDPDYRLAVLFLDLDRFKLINDSLGHAAGDKLLTTVAERLRRCVRGGDTVSDCAADPVRGGRNGHTVARLAGDEFTVLLDGLRTPADAERVADRILLELAKPVEFGGREIRTAASIGIVHADGRRYTAASQLLADADAALYKAKAAGRGRYAVFDANAQQSAQDRLRLAGELRRAMEHGQFVLHYQPIVSLDDREVTGFEALLRWEHPERGLLEPEQFLDLADETGLIVPLGNWVLQEVCRQLADWRQQCPRRHPFSLHPGTTTATAGSDLFAVVTLSRQQLLDPGLVRLVRGLQEQRRDALTEGWLRLTIDEAVLMQNHEAVNGILKELRSAGVRVWVGNFGAGVTSLGCLRSTALDGLKIDGRIVGSATGRRDYAAVMHSVLDLARNLRLQVAAEGLETAEQVAMLQAMGGDLGQGPYFAPPLTPVDVEKVIAAQSLIGPARSA